MTDIVDAATRSRMMSQIRGKDTNIELTVRRYLHKNGFRFRLHRKDLPGKPDLYLTRHQTAIFVHGCFWHGHDCHLFRLPKTRTAWWKAKLNRNRERDVEAAAACRRLGLKVIEVWECSLRGKSAAERDACLASVVRKLTGRSSRSSPHRVERPSIAHGEGPA